MHQLDESQALCPQTLVRGPVSGRCMLEPGHDGMCEFRDRERRIRWLADRSKDPGVNNGRSEQTGSDRAE
jgi:hypothetical protein